MQSSGKAGIQAHGVRLPGPVLFSTRPARSRVPSSSTSTHPAEAVLTFLRGIGGGLGEWSRPLCAGAPLPPATGDSCGPHLVPGCPIARALCIPACWRVWNLPSPSGSTLPLAPCSPRALLSCPCPSPSLNTSSASASWR